MWDETLIESRGARKRGRIWLTFPVALLIHALVIGVFIGTSYWSVEALQAPPIPLILIDRKPIPEGGSLSTIRKQTSNPENGTANKTPEFVQPPVIPENLLQQESEVQDVQTGSESSNEVVGSTSDGPPGPPCSEPCYPGRGSPNAAGNEFDRPIIITPEVTLPVLIRKITPVYPSIAIRAHIQGVVLLEAVITRTGTVEELRVLHSPHPLLDQAAVNAVKQWLYRPALVNGKSVKVYFNVTVEFKIQ